MQVHPSVASLKTSVSLNFLVEKGVADVAPPNFDQVRSQGLLVSSRSKGAGRKKEPGNEVKTKLYSLKSWK